MIKKHLEIILGLAETGFNESPGSWLMSSSADEAEAALEEFRQLVHGRRGGPGAWEYRFMGDPDAYPPDGDRGGETYDRELDYVRLNKEQQIVFDAIRHGAWFTLVELSELTGLMPQSISARLRDFRKKEFGGLGRAGDQWPVERRRRD